MKLELPAATTVLGVSGGADSTALLVAAVAGGHRVVAAHFHHGLRGREADEDAEAVRDLADRLGVPFVLGRAEPPAGPDEASARRARYAFLLGVARARGAPAVAVAHTADDQAETVLMRLIRGAGARGLGGMAPSRPLGEGVVLLRPLLRYTRAEVVAYLRRRGIPYREDSSNADRRRLRNRVRHELLPLLRTYNPRIVEVLCRTAQLLREDEAALQAWPEGAEPPPAVVRRRLREAWQRRTGSPYPLNFRHVEGLLRGRVDLPGKGLRS
jgi:tRNA(Ile)-lysidine synthase